MIGDDKVAFLETHPAFAAWSALNIGSQQQMWRALEDMVVRQAPHMDAVASGLADGASRLGSLQTDPNLTMPAYFADTAYHGQPGGYCLDRGANDWHADALQEAGGTLCSRGAGTGVKDSKGQAVVRFLATTFPEFAPDRVVDLGCGYGGQTGHYAAAYPEAEIFGVDLGGGLLRYIDTQAFVSQPGPPCSVISPAFNPAANCGGFFAWSGTNIGGGSVIPRGFGITLPRGRQIGATIRFNF